MRGGTGDTGGTRGPRDAAGGQWILAEVQAGASAGAKCEGFGVANATSRHSPLALCGVDGDAGLVPALAHLPRHDVLCPHAVRIRLHACQDLRPIWPTGIRFDDVHGPGLSLHGLSTVGHLLQHAVVHGRLRVLEVVDGKVDHQLPVLRLREELVHVMEHPHIPAAGLYHHVQPLLPCLVDQQHTPDLGNGAVPGEDAVLQCCVQVHIL
mmetsp:Transcript_14373/g.25582  ORF Transcript_14373/g.25582 Transcript_14373/m.25582 type:complete len:209 (-) Transcript_14373:1059-1685(-)